MHVLLLYDIPNDRARVKVADTCQNYGLDRTQYSAFVGELSRNHQNELMRKVLALLRDKPGKVLLIPIGADEWSRRQEFSAGMDQPTPDDIEPVPRPKRGPEDEPF